MTAYDNLRYNNLANPNTHPGRLFVLAKLAGLNPAPLDTCRVLELGTSEGTNLIGMAVAMPQASFTGVDLAHLPIERGNALLAKLKLSNVALQTGDLLELGAEFRDRHGPFDYILTHGIYGWTPPQVGEKVLELARLCLAPDGVAFVSYNTLPAGHIRQMVRDMLLYHTGGIDDPQERLKSAREFLTVLALGRPEPEYFDAAAADYASTLLKHSDSALFHDDLAPLYQPVHFHEFIDRAAVHGLQYCGEATGYNPPRNLKKEAIEAARQNSGGNFIREQQYLDFLRMRGFRQTLLCHQEIAVKHDWSPSDIAGCFAHTTAVEVTEHNFTSADNTRMSTSHPVPVALMRRLIDARPRSIQVTTEDAAVALELFKVGVIELRGEPSIPKAGAPGESQYPVASPLARQQIEMGESVVTTLWHRPLEIADDQSRQALLLLDGTRNRETLSHALECSREVLDAEITTLGRLSLLVE